MPEHEDHDGHTGYLGPTDPEGLTPEQEPVELDRLRKLIADMEANLHRISAGWEFARAERDEARRRLLTVERERDRLRAELADSERRFADAVTDPRRPASDE